MYSLRPYQTESVNALWGYLCSQKGNPVVVLPTGAGKSLVIAQACRDAVQRFNGRAIVLAHRRELLTQNAEKIANLLPDMDVGVYSAGLRSRDADNDIVVAGIQSVYQRAHDFGHRNLIIIDEAHLVPHDGEGMYRTFLDNLRSANPKLRMVGTTATPFRLDIGPLCRPDALFQKVCYSANIRELIEAGYLTNLITRSAAGSADTSGLRVVRGEFATGDSAALFNSLVAASCAEIVAATRERQSVLVFCSGVNHADQVATELARLTGERCGLVTGETLPIERSATLAAFGSRQLRYLCNVDVLTTGFDAPCIDCIAILRATMSAGLYAQICGRGFRMFPGKENCLVLDFGENIKRHGPLDAIEYGRCKRTGLQPGEAPRKTCPNCEAECYAGSANCQECGLEFPSRELNHAGQADTETPILSEPEYWIVEEVYYAIHEKKKKSDGPLTMRVDYVCQPVNGEGNLSSKQISEWVCIEHEGFAWKKAAAWWKARSIAPMPATVEEAVELARCGALAAPDRITTQRDGRWYRILSARLDERPTEWAASEEEMMDEVPF